jgi:hypothetical protein
MNENLNENSNENKKNSNENKKISNENENNEKNENENNENDDDRLIYVLITLGIENLIKFFEEKKITFIDFLLLSKEDLKELELNLFQRNRILNFIKFYCKKAKNYSISEIYNFFLENKQFIFNSVIYDNINNNINNNNNIKTNKKFNSNKKKYKKRNVIKKFINIQTETEIFLNKLEKEQEKYYNIQKKYYHILNNNNNNNNF